MDLNKATMSAFSNKVSAQLDEATAKINEFGAIGKEHVAQGQLDAIKELRTMKDAISKKHHELKSAGDDQASKIKSDIESHLASLHTSLEGFVKRFREHAKAS